MIDDNLHFYSDGVETIVVGDPFGPTQVPKAKLRIESTDHIGYPSYPPSVKLEMVTKKEQEERMRIEINALVPKTPIHIAIGEDEYTGEDIREWAKETQDWPDWQGSLLIKYLSRIIVSQVLDKGPAHTGLDT